MSLSPKSTVSEPEKAWARSWPREIFPRQAYSTLVASANRDDEKNLTSSEDRLKGGNEQKIERETSITVSSEPVIALDDPLEANEIQEFQIVPKQIARPS